MVCKVVWMKSHLVRWLSFQPDENAQREDFPEGVPEGELAAFQGEIVPVMAGNGEEAGVGFEAEGFADGGFT